MCSRRSSGRRRAVERRWGLLIFLGMAEALVAAAMLIDERLAERAVVRGAERRSLAWVEYAAHRLARIEELARCALLLCEDRRAIADMAAFGGVLRFKLFGPDGGLRFGPDDLAGAGGSLGAHNPAAAAVVATLEPCTVVADGRAKSDRPDLYSETCLPVVRGGEVVAVIETYLDQTGTQRAMRADLAVLGSE